MNFHREFEFNQEFHDAFMRQMEIQGSSGSALPVRKGVQMIKEELAERFVCGEKLEGEDAAIVLKELTTYGPWRLWVQVALAFLNADRIEQAAHVLSQLLTNTEEDDAKSTNE